MAAAGDGERRGGKEGVDLSRDHQQVKEGGGRRLLGY